jgi:hypothetical protein
VPGGHHEHQRVPAEAEEPERAGRLFGQAARPVVDQGDVGLPRLDLPDALGRPELPEHERQVGVLGEAARQGGRVGHRRGGEGGHRHPAGRPARVRRQLGLRGLGQGQDVLGPGGQQPARVGQFRAARGAVEQRRAGLPLQRRELLGDRGGGVPEGAGGGRDAALPGELDEQPQPAEIEHQGSLRSASTSLACNDANRG